MQQYGRGASNPSGTAQGLLGAGQLLAIPTLAYRTATGQEDVESFSTKLLGLLSPLALGKGLYSRTGQRLLTSQPLSPASQGGGMATLMKILGVGGVDEIERRRR